MAENPLVLGLDFGTDSVRSVVVDSSTGEEIAKGVSEYTRWKEGKYSNPAKNRFRQHPLDYLEAMVSSVKDTLTKLPSKAVFKIDGIGIDTTGSTPCPVDREGRPLALNPRFSDNPNAMFILWKDHTAVQEAEEINRAAHIWKYEDYTRFSGGAYSSEWFWSKILHVIREDSEVRESAWSWVEHCDWIPALLTGTTDPSLMKRSRCAAGHKAMWHALWGGLPPEEFLKTIDPLLKGLRERLYSKTATSDTSAGRLTEEWAEKMGLKPGIAVAVGAIDAHAGAVGGGVREGVLSKVMGTSTCDMLVAPYSKIGNTCIQGISGQVDGSIVPGMIGLEAGQAAFGDIYAWYREILSWPLKTLYKGLTCLSPKEREALTDESEKKLLPTLEKEAERISPKETHLLALDWFNGRRTPYGDQNLKGAIMGLRLGTTAPAIYRALVEATAFGAKAILDHFSKHRIRIDEVVALGGIAKKSSFVMQVMSDVLGMPISVVASEETCALGSAMYAAVASGIYPTVPEAQNRMGGGIDKIYHPDKNKSKTYNEFYRKYRNFGRLLEERLKKL
ncbi:MAG: ribulokinase [Spirochaetes bacterium]|nr:MAG: ribulokinase [Spirochaetota bacterium]